MPIRKRLVDSPPSSAASGWLAVEDLARIEVTSEDSAYPVDAALLADHGPGWRAARPGAQFIRLIFDDAQQLGLIHLVFADAEQERVQEFTLRWSPDHGRTYQEIVRQQFSFSPSGATRQVEDYVVRLDGVTDLELAIIPDISRGPAVATLTEFRLR